MVKLTDQQWQLLAKLLAKADPEPATGRPRVAQRAILNGVLWILRTGAQWNELPASYPPYQTVHRRYQRWVRSGLLAELLRLLATDMEARGGISLQECFIDGTFASAKKGELVLVLPAAAKAPNSWSSATAALFRSPSTWALLLRTRSPWWKQRLPADLPKRLQPTW